MAEEKKEVSQPAATPAAKTGEDKAFSQEDVNRIVSQRVNEVRDKYRDYDTFRDKAQTLDNMMDDTRFQKFLEGITSHPAGRQSTESVVSTGLDELPEFQELKKLDPDLAPVVVKLVTKLTEERVSKQTQPLQREMDEAKARKAVEEVNAMKADVENWPAMQSLEFQQDMAKCFMPNPATGLPRATSLEDAYLLTERNWKRQNRDIPNSPSSRAKSKSDAELLESREGGGAVASTEKPPKFKDAREAAEWSMKKLGWI